MTQVLQQTVTEKTSEMHSQRFFKLQIKGWTRFDPSTMELAEIAKLIGTGAGFVSSIEVTKIADSLAAVDDVDIRDSFETLLAAERLVGRIHELPPAIRERLRSALLKQQEEKAPAVAA